MELRKKKWRRSSLNYEGIKPRASAALLWLSSLQHIPTNVLSRDCLSSSFMSFSNPLATISISAWWISKQAMKISEYNTKVTQRLNGEKLEKQKHIQSTPRVEICDEWGIFSIVLPLIQNVCPVFPEPAVTWSLHMTQKHTLVFDTLSYTVIISRY